MGVLQKINPCFCNRFSLKFIDDNQSTISARCIYENKRGRVVVHALSYLEQLIKLGHRVRAANLMHTAWA